MIVHVIIGADQFKIDTGHPDRLEAVAPFLSQWFDALALAKRIDILSHPAGGTLRLTLAEDTPPSR